MAKKTLSLKKNVPLKIFQLNVSLPETEPLVWRRILVPSDFTLEALHSVVQLTMGWQMSHLYDFQIGKSRYAAPDDFDDSPVSSIDTCLANAIGNEKTFGYNYDFGDDWRHKIVVEKIVDHDEKFNYPCCIGGENACPPEDCHGVGAYQDLKEVIANPKNPEHDEMIRWLGGYFDPTTFDPNRINRDMLWMTDWKSGPNDQGLYRPFNFEQDELTD